MGHDVFKNDFEDDKRDPQGVDDIVENHDYPEEAHPKVEDAPMDAVAPEDTDEYEYDEVKLEDMKRQHSICTVDQLSDVLKTKLLKQFHFFKLKYFVDGSFSFLDIRFSTKTI